MKSKIVIMLLMMLCAVSILNAVRQTDPGPHCNPLDNPKGIGGIINSSASIVIQNGAFVVISGQGNYLSQGTGITAGSGTLELTGNLVNNNSSGNPLSVEGTVSFSGDSTQSISGNPITFTNVSFNNPEGISIECQTEIEGDMTITSGTVRMTEDNNIWLSNKDIAIGGENSLSALNVTLIPEPGIYYANESIDKRWNITGLSSGEVLVTLRWTDAENNGNDFSSEEAKVFTHDGNAWSLVGSYPITIDGIYNTLSFLRSFSGKDDLGDYTITGDNQTLPVTLSFFSGMQVSMDLVRLSWISQSESSLSGYHVLRGESEDISSAIVVSNLIPATNTSSIQTYTYNDDELQGEGLYFYWLMFSEFSGEAFYHGPITVEVTNEPENPGTPGIPLETKLLPPYPNPFNPSTRIVYELRQAEPVLLEIYDLRGRLVWNRMLEHSQPGRFSQNWEGMDNQGYQVTSGVYFCKMKAGDYSQVQKLIMLK